MVDLYIAEFVNATLVIIMTVGIIGNQKFSEWELTINEELNEIIVIVV